MVPSPFATQALMAQPINPIAFQPYGQLIEATEDGQSYGAGDAQLVLSPGIPRFYIMRLRQRGRSFNRITRHQHCTQCLGSLAGQPWFLAVAPPSLESWPDLNQLMAFQIPGTCFVKLQVGTWHAGPYFDAPQVDFYNLELSDTNITDHETYAIVEHQGYGYTIVDTVVPD